jgi:hypothetical protein
LKAFAASRGITFPLVSDPKSTIIRRYGLLNETIEPGNRAYGVPHPGTFIVDRAGVVTARFFEDVYQERSTAGSVLTRLGLATPDRRLAGEAPHLRFALSTSDASVAPGERITVALDIEPAPGIHVYAPGPHSYQVVRFDLEPQPWLRTHSTVYPPSEVYHFKPLDERVNVFMKPFRVSVDLTILATPEVQKQLAAQDALSLSGSIAYQACDDSVCFNPVRVPIGFQLAVRPLDRRPPGV